MSRVADRLATRAEVALLVIAHDRLQVLGQCAHAFQRVELLQEMLIAHEQAQALVDKRHFERWHCLQPLSEKSNT